MRAYGSDLNPVAVLISKALVEIPPRFAGRPPVHPGADPHRHYRGAQGIAEDVRHYGKWMRDEAERRIGHLYPKARLPDGSEATVIAWLWARTVRSPDPKAKGARVPLVSSFMLSTKEGRKAWIEPVLDPAAPDGWRFEVRTGALSKADEETLKNGTKVGQGQFRCLLTGASLTEECIRKEFSAGRGAWRAIAVIAEGKRGKIYLPIDAAPVPEIPESQLAEVPRQEMFRGALGFRLQPYGVLIWGDFFRPRQCIALSTFGELVEEAQQQICADAELTRTDAKEYSRAVASYLLCAFGRAIDYSTINTMWEPGGGFVIHTFSEMTIPIVWDSVEANLFASGGGGWMKTCLDWVCRVIEVLPTQGKGKIECLRAQDLKPAPTTTFSIDPPYFDNIGYADLSDAFYVWERWPLAAIFPEIARRLSTPKEDELVATPARHGGAVGARDFFLNGMTDVFAGMKESVSTDPITIYYSYKEKGRVGEGTGWESFLEAIVGPGWQIDASWPLKTERPTRNRSIGKAALASAILLVGRKRPANASVVDRAAFLTALRRELPAAVDKLRKAGIAPVDMQQSVIGPGMGVFSRYARVLEDDDTRMTVKTALTLINRVWGEIEDDLDTNFDPETQVALAWFSSYSFDARPAGDLINIATAKNIPIQVLFRSGVFVDLRGRAALTPRDKLPEDWSPATDRLPTVWECVQHTARILRAEEGGSEAAARLVALIGSRAEAARALAYRLYEIASKKGWAAEALVYNELAQDWTNLEDRAMRYQPAAAMPDLFGVAAR